MADYSKLDHFSLKAQKDGYPARSVYKLQEMDEKFGLIKTASLKAHAPFKVLDLGAAPGSWSLYVMRKLAGICGRREAQMPLLAAIDLAPLSRQYDQGLFDDPSFLFLQGDFTSAEIQEKIFSCAPYNLVLSDAAPATTGNRSVDTLRSLGLAETVLHYAEAVLAKNGNMAIKVFQGGDTGALLKKMRSLFKTAKSFKPRACRPESFETYFVGLGKK
ncbi:MAG: RlmE family RNA methyltransferase [Treponema sp.]|nr:RlmE family RNA methyltransferase [Treponema sp.]